MVILTKRRKFILSSLFLSFGLYIVEVAGFEWKYRAIGLLALAAGILTTWSLAEAAFGLSKLMTPILPILFTTGVALFYFLLPGSTLTVLPVILFYFLGMYALLLTENIFSVASIRTINLFRSASAVGFLLTLLTAFFLNNTALSLKLAFYFNFLLVFFLSFPLVLAGLWSVNLEERMTSKLFLFSLAISLFLGQLALGISFWPVTVTVGSLFLTASLYVLLGLSQAYLSEKLFPKTVREFFLVGVVVFLVVILYTQWG